MRQGIKMLRVVGAGVLVVVSSIVLAIIGLAAGLVLFLRVMWEARARLLLALLFIAMFPTTVSMVHAGAQFALSDRCIRAARAIGTNSPLVQANLEPEDPKFGDIVTAELIVRMDETAAELGSVEVFMDFAPFTVVGDVEREDVSVCGVSETRFITRLQCIDDDACVPEDGPLELKLTPARVTYLYWTRAKGSVELVEREKPGTWPVLTIISNLEEEDRQKFKLDEGSYAEPTALKQPERLGIARALRFATFVLPFIGVIGAPLLYRRFTRPESVADPLEPVLKALREAERALDEPSALESAHLLAHELKKTGRDDVQPFIDEIEQMSATRRSVTREMVHDVLKRVRTLLGQDEEVPS